MADSCLHPPTYTPAHPLSLRLHPCGPAATPNPEDLADGLLMPDGTRVRVASAKVRVNETYWTLDPRRLDLTEMVPVQLAAVAWARRAFQTMRLWILDTRDGVQHFEQGFDLIYRYTQPPSSARVWIYDHMFDVSYRGNDDVNAFKYMVSTLKTSNNDWGTTGIIVNQRNEGANAGRAGTSYGSWMGGALPAVVDHLFTLNDTNYDPRVMQVAVTASRWDGPISHQYVVNAPSGYVINHRSAPPTMEAFVRAAQG